MSFFEELRRRSVIKVAFAYAVTGWILAEVGNYAADTFNAPDWVMQMFTVLLILGFPIALILAWAFEVTPEGVKRTPGSVFGRKKTPEAEDESKSIAVLPFANLSTDPENEYFADGLSEELLNVLAHIDGLRVAGRTSCFAFKGENKDLREIGEKLGVGYILEGSVRKSGNNIRITAQLVSSADGYHLWSETYDRELDDIFVIQDEIAKAVTDMLRVKLLGESESDVRRTEDGTVYAAYLEGRFHQRRMKFEELKKAVALYAEVLEESPDYVPALASSAEAWIHMVAGGDVPYDEGWPRAKAFIDKALEIDPDYAEAQMVQGFFLGWWEHDMVGAEKHLRRAIELNPNFADAYRRLGAHLRMLLRHEEALSCFETAVSIDPLSAINLRQLAYTYACMERYGEAEELLHKAMDMDPQAGGLHYNLGELYFRQNDSDRARPEFEKEHIPWMREFGEALLGIRESSDEEARKLADAYRESVGESAGYQMGVLYCQIGDREKSLDWLEQAERERDPGVMQMLMDPFLEPIRDEPRFQALARKLNLTS
ncbi:MAG: tetratricopeptide repeat protein [Gammaproteobacteria bacterium]|nr:MAG: tetratricopeptide repeat protein [Gammaproteobacteria bacterium]